MYPTFTSGWKIVPKAANFTSFPCCSGTTNKTTSGHLRLCQSNIYTTSEKIFSYAYLIENSLHNKKPCHASGHSSHTINTHRLTYSTDWTADKNRCWGFAWQLSTACSIWSSPLVFVAYLHRCWAIWLEVIAMQEELCTHSVTDLNA